MNSATGSNTKKKHSSSQIFPSVPQFFGHWFGEREVAGEGPVGVAMKGLHLDPEAVAR